MKINRSGFSLTEIVIAVMVFAIVSVPLYYAISFGSKEEIHLEKVSMANKVLEAFRDEIMNLDYKTVESLGNNFDGTQMPPKSFSELLAAQDKFKDLKLTAVSVANETNDARTITAEVTWKREGKGDSSVKISFVKVKK